MYFLKLVNLARDGTIRAYVGSILFDTRPVGFETWNIPWSQDSSALMNWIAIFSHKRSPPRLTGSISRSIIGSIRRGEESSTIDRHNVGMVGLPVDVHLPGGGADSGHAGGGPGAVAHRRSLMAGGFFVEQIHIFSECPANSNFLLRLFWSKVHCNQFLKCHVF